MKHIVGFSGGIDSQTAALLVRKHWSENDVVLLRSRAGRNEHEITDRWVEWYSANIFPVTEVVPLYRDLWETEPERRCKEHGFNPDGEITFLDLVKFKGRFPSKRAQFCTEVLKLRPQKRWIFENIPDADYEFYSGVRCDEPNRKHLKLRYWDTFFDCWVNSIVLDWKKEWCFQIVKEAGETHNPLYDMGFERVGCNFTSCVNAKSKDAILNAYGRFGQTFRDRINSWEVETGWTFFPPCVPGMRMNFIDEVIAWAQTDRGGRQANAFRVLNETSACESKYGTCE